MEAAMKLAQIFKSLFEARDRSRGEQYFSAGTVIALWSDGQIYRAAVEGSQGDYDVEIGPGDVEAKGNVATLHLSCTCGRFAEGFNCKHLWATILKLDQLKCDFSHLNSEPFDIVGEGDDSLIYEDDNDNGLLARVHSLVNQVAIEQLMSRGMGARGGQIKSQRAGKTPSWKTHLQQLPPAPPQLDDPWNAATGKRREVWYVLDIAASLACGQLAIGLHYRETKKSGEFGKCKPLTLSPRQIGDWPLADDRAALALLIGNDTSQYYGNGYMGAYSQAASGARVSPMLHEELLPRLAATQRFVWLLGNGLAVEEGRPLTWDAGPPWQFCVRYDEDAAARCWRMTGEFRRGDQTRAINDAVMTSATGVVMWPDCFARLDVGGDFAWLTLLRKQHTIDIPFADRNEFVAQLWSRPALPPGELPPALACQQQPGNPRGVLRVMKQERNGYYRAMDELYATVQFDYDGQTIRLDDARSGLVDAAADKVLIRDSAAETRLLAELSGLKVRPVQDRYRAPEADVQFGKKRLHDLVAALVKLGWQVEAEGMLIKSPGEFRVAVTSGVDWFDLDATVDYDGTPVQLPALLAALRKGEKFVELGDGQRGMLPEDWLAKFGNLAEFGEVEGEKLRFRPTQALLLDALVAAQEHVQVDRNFAKFREKLRKFDGVQPAAAPKLFAGELREYQKQGLGWLHFLREFQFGGCLADDMGLGKTIQVLALLEARRSRRLSKDETRRPSLVVAPKSLIFNWIEEAARFTPKLRVLNYTGVERKARLDSIADYDLALTTYGTLRQDIASLKDVRFDYAILDESQAIKNATSQSAKACRLIAADHRLAMTGTPVENHLGELWSLFEFLNPGMLGRSTSLTGLTKAATGGDSASLELLRRGLAPFMLRRTKEQVLTELPEKTEQTLYCEMETDQRKAYDELREYYRTLLQQRVAEVGMQKAKIYVLDALLRLRQAACHPALIDPKKAKQSSAKLETLLEQLDEVVAEGHKALVFSQFTSLLDIVRKRIDERKITYEYLDGKTRNRQQKVERFQTDAHCPLFLISLKAGGQGLNLTAADYVFILDPWWNPAVEAQAVDRAHRMGQTRRVFAYRLICRDTVEDKILELQKQKRDLADAIISADGSVIRSLTSDDLQLLLS